MGKAYKTGKQTYSARARTGGHDLFISGYATKTEAKDELDRQVRVIKKRGKPLHEGPQRTTLAYALQEFGLQHLPNLKGAAQEARRINKYLKACDLQLLEVLPKTTDSEPNDEPVEPGVYKGLHASLRLGPKDAVAVIPNGLGPYRKKLIAKTNGSDAARQRLAATCVADIKDTDVQDLMTALSRDGLAPASVALERALLRGFFNYARRAWRWSAPECNPARELKMPKIKNERDRVMSMEEQRMLDQAIHESRNSLMGPVFSLLTETAMRASEPLQHAKWGDVDWEANILRLRDAKAGGREVPLSPKAMEILRSLQPGKPDEPIVRVTYEAIKAGWRRVCERAGVKNLRLQDLRHTAATRMALKTGNVFLVKALTGHETLEMVERYVNVKASDVVNVMHGEKPNSLLAGIAQPHVEQPVPAQPTSAEAAPVKSQTLGAPKPGLFQLSSDELQALVGSAVAQAVAALQAEHRP